MKKAFFCLLFSLAPIFTAYCFENSQNMESYVQDGDNEKKVFDAKQLIAPAALMTTGTLVHCFGHETWDFSINEQVLEWRGNGQRMEFDDYTQYLGLASFVTLGLTGLESKHNLSDRCILFGLSFVSSAVITRGLKMVINSPRPDFVPIGPDGQAISDRKSFPSGHTQTAFLGAELVRMEYGWGWGTGAYLVAIGTAYMRMYNQKHWFSDLLMGAGIGILGAHIGEWLLEPVKGLFRPKNTIIGATIEPLSGVPCMALCYSF